MLIGQPAESPSRPGLGLCPSSISISISSLLREGRFAVASHVAVLGSEELLRGRPTPLAWRNDHALFRQLGDMLRDALMARDRGLNFGFAQLVAEHLPDVTA